MDILTQLSQQARAAVQRRDWNRVALIAGQIQQQFPQEPEGYFLSGLVEKATGRGERAIQAFAKSLSLDSQRYDAAVELANQYWHALRHGEAFKLLDHHEPQLQNSPLYLDMAARIFSGLGLHDRAWPLFEKANQLQPEVDLFRANLAACGILLGKVEQAKAIYQSLLKKYPQHQKNHYEFAKIQKAKDSTHVEQMKAILNETNLPADKNIFLYYAIGKELEDLEHWKESFEYYKLAGEAVLSVAKYEVEDDIKVIDKTINVCNSEWLTQGQDSRANEESQKTPIFIVGLPRTGTTLTERIISSHSKVESADETFFMQIAIRHASGEGGLGDASEAIVEKASKNDINLIAQKYLDSIEYRLSGQPMFIDKYPFNYLYLGFIAKAFLKARIVYLRRNPLDACFALFKQSFFKFAYSLEDLGRYYVAQDKLRRHWQALLGERIVEVEYEKLIADQEGQTRYILQRLGLDFEEACMQFEQNPTASATASTLQVREKIHARSVHKWKRFAEQLQPLKKYLTDAGINTGDA